MTDEKGNKTAEPNDKTWHVSTCLQVTERGVKSNDISKMNVLTVRLLLLLQLPLLSLWDGCRHVVNHPFNPELWSNCFASPSGRVFPAIMLYSFDIPGLYLIELKMTEPWAVLRTHAPSLEYCATEDDSTRSIWDERSCFRPQRYSHHRGCAAETRMFGGCQPWRGWDEMTLSTLMRLRTLECVEFCLQQSVDFTQSCDGRVSYSLLGSPVPHVA